MFTCKKILAVTDPTLEQQTPILRALKFAQKSGATIVVFSCIYDKSYDMTSVLNREGRVKVKEAMIEQERIKLETQIKQLNANSKVKIVVVVEWHKKLHEAVINTCNEHSCDLIIKATKKHGILSSSLFTAADWHIARNSTVNLLLVKSHEWPQKPTILTAIGVSAKDDAHILLGDKVAETAYELSQLLDGNLHFANSYAGAPVQVTVELPSFSPEIYNKTVQKRHEEQLQSLAKKYKVDEANTHVQEGLPEDMIRIACQQYHADLVVIGSVGRKGLTAALLGNTAELIIDSVDCDTLIVKIQ